VVNRWHKKYLKAVFLLFLAFFGAGILWIYTKNGLELTEDSVSYLCAAKNLITEHRLSALESFDKPTLFVPMMHHAPFLSFLIAGLNFFNIEILNAARYLNILFFFLSILLIGSIVYGSTLSLLAAIFAVTIFLFSRVILTIYLMVWSEPAFIFFEISGLFLLAAYLQKQKLSFLLASSAFISLACLTRYAGASLIIAGIVILLFRRELDLHKRIKDVFVFGLIGGLPAFLWLLVMDSPRNKFWLWVNCFYITGVYSYLYL